MQIMKSERTQALEWWNSLSDFEKIEYYILYTNLFFSPALSYKQLTGREVQTIKKTFYEASDNRPSN